jgi:hypothetical protein
LNTFWSGLHGLGDLGEQRTMSTIVDYQ